MPLATLKLCDYLLNNAGIRDDPQFANGSGHSQLRPCTAAYTEHVHSDRTSGLHRWNPRTTLFLLRYFSLPSFRCIGIVLSEQKAKYYIKCI